MSINNKIAHNRIDLSGKKINFLTVIHPVKKEGNSKDVYWQCECECGNKPIIAGPLLRSKTRQIKSCGCQRNDLLSKLYWKGYEEISSTYFSSLKYGAASRDIKFNVTIEQIWELFLKQDRKCAITGIDLVFSRQLLDQTASLDRIDASKNYDIDNLMWVHKRINILRMQMPLEDFKKWCKLVVDYNNI